MSVFNEGDREEPCINCDNSSANLGTHNKSKLNLKEDFFSIA